MKFVRWLLIVSLLVISVNSYAEDKCIFDVIFQNDSDTAVSFNFQWIDHPIVEIDYPLEMVKGELKANETWKATDTYLCGEYLVIWDDGESKFNYAFSQRDWMENPRILHWPHRIYKEAPDPKYSKVLDYGWNTEVPIDKPDNVWNILKEWRVWDTREIFIDTDNDGKCDFVSIWMNSHEQDEQGRDLYIQFPNEKCDVVENQIELFIEVQQELARKNGI